MKYIMNSFVENTRMNDLVVNYTVNNEFEMQNNIIDWGLLLQQTATAFKPWHHQR